ncbi:MAG: TRAM domain-containing protein [Myxococcota bacterium]|nr:TRAM domain-containing protein [Myxococcota bacterium]
MSRGVIVVASAEAHVEIERLASGGDGIGRLADGCAIFVPFSAPGDRLRVRIVERKAHHARGEIIEIERRGPARRTARCAVFGVCGGCAWQHLEYEAQLEAKSAILLDALERIGRLSPPDLVSLHGSPDEFGYRTRARVVVAGGRVGFRRVRSHQIQPIETCPVLAPEVDALLDEAASIGVQLGTPAEIELSAGTGGPARATRVGDDAAVGSVELAVAGDRLRVSPGVFAQANRSLLALLRAAVLRSAGEGRRVAELFAGGGLFTLGLARRFERVLAVEAQQRATDDLAFNLEQAGLRGGVEIWTQPVERALTQLADFEPEVVVLDPPRSGLERLACERLGRLGAGRIVYLSCDPATLARDLRWLCESGYEIEHLEGFDLFPQTHHVEALAVLTISGGQPGG